MSEPQVAFQKSSWFADCRPSDAYYEWITAKSDSDLQWTANGFDTYGKTLKALSDIFAWKQSDAVLENVGILSYSECLRRVQSLLDFVGLHDSKLCKAMRDSFENLSLSARARFMMAPETVYRISALRKEAKESIVALVGFLNAETACGDLTAGRPGQYWTALGDFYYADGNLCPAAEHGQVRWVADQSFCAPKLAGTIPIDFFSPNVAHAKETTLQGRRNYDLELSPEEKFVICERLADAYTRIGEVSEAAAQLIKQFVRVIVPVKSPSGWGSTSKRSFPGRIMLQGVERVRPAKIAAALVHEAIHQLLYVLEYVGRFVIIEPKDRVRSLWSGRVMAVDNFFHACFVWYGLANFWALARNSSAFDSDHVRQALNECLLGFRGENPIDVLKRHPGCVRGDALAIADAFQSRLSDVMHTIAA
ncbi:MAG: hypothetical protein JO340_11705 [Acidobacteriaceae bacterium]|nr:hypothetical protein [Acidobacteriaceae bacterium]